MDDTGTGIPPSAAVCAGGDERLEACLRALRQVQQLARVGTWRHEVADGSLWWSEELYRIFGLDPGAGPLSLPTLLALIHPDDRDTFAAQVASGEPHRSDYRIVLPGGELRHIHEEVRVERDERGAAVRMVGTAQDVSARAEAEKALHNSEKMLQTIIEAEPECVKLLDKDGNLIFMNRAGLEMIQAESLEQVRGRCVCPMVGSAYRQAFLELTSRAFAGGSGTLLFEMEGLKGRRLWLETHAVPLRDEQDRIVAVLGVTRDVTEQRRAEAALRASEARFRSIIEAASVGILVAEVPSGRFRYANPEICRMLGYDEGELLSLAPADLAVPEERPASAAGFQAHAAGTVRATERTFRRKDGSAVPVAIHSVAMDFDGRPCVVGFFADVTARRQLEEERLRAQKLESIGTLAGGIAHDFNNLLQGVFGYLSMAKFSLAAPEEALAMLAQAERALHLSVGLTTQLLTFAKGGKPVKKAINLRPVVENAARFALSGSNVTFELRCDEGVAPVEADEAQIGQVVQNIVLNAEQAMPRGGVVEISVKNAPPGKAAELSPPGGDGLVQITVHDHGTGIPPADLARIFDPYFTTKKKGSGLGLATSYSIVRNHGGAIQVQSEPGKGSTFSVYLPAAAAAASPQAAAAACAPSGRCRVLVMDDEDFVCEVAGKLLESLGHQAVTVQDGAEAVAQYEAAMAAGTPFDVVILDLTIRGGMGGQETVGRLRALNPAVRAVVSSGYSDDDVMAGYAQHGFRAYLRKPYSIAELTRALAEATA